MTTPNDKDGGAPAFPHLETTSRGEPFHDHLGITIRDYFAAKALQGLIASTAHPDCIPLSTKPDKIAEGAYKIADAMLKARLQAQEGK